MKIEKIPRNIVAVKSGSYVVGGVAVVGLLYLLSRKNDVGESVSERIIDRVTDSTSEIISNTGMMPAQVVVGTAQKTVKVTEESVSETVFKKKSDDVGRSYSTFMKEQPIAVRGGVAAGNIVSGKKASEYGRHVAEQTQQYVPGSVGQFKKIDTGEKIGVGIGQMITVPFTKGGAAGVGYRAGEELKEKMPKTAKWIGKWF